jgi:hypothetical protein
MLRVEMHDCVNAFIIRIDGPFTGECAGQLRTLVALCNTPMRLLIDLTEVTAIDSAGEAVLFWLGNVGYQFIAQSPYAADVCRRLDLNQVRKTSARVRAKSYAR